jgi:hypothetical protein
MTELGEFLSQMSIKKVNMRYKTFMNTLRLNELNRNKSSKLIAEEMFVFTLGIDVEPNEIITKVYGHLKLKKVK